MNISDHELRAMVREAIARTRQDAPADDLSSSSPSHTIDALAHASHARLGRVTGGDADGQCLIEPAVRCNHCGYCQSLGH